MLAVLLARGSAWRLNQLPIFMVIDTSIRYG
jgi:hypothetical protein